MKAKYCIGATSGIAVVDVLIFVWDEMGMHGANRSCKIIKG
jgi:hypothetical protein